MHIDFIIFYQLLVFFFLFIDFTFGKKKIFSYWPWPRAVNSTRAAIFSNVKVLDPLSSEKLFSFLSPELYTERNLNDSDPFTWKMKEATSLMFGQQQYTAVNSYYNKKVLRTQLFIETKSVQPNDQALLRR